VSIVSAIPSTDFPIEEQWTALEGGRVRYLRCGSGPPVIALHGLMGYSFSWRFLIPALAPSFTVFAPDSLGTGFSDRPAAMDNCQSACAERFLAFLDAMHVERADFIGSSHGGAICMRAAALAPNRVRRLVLVSPVNPWSDRGRMLGPFLSSTVISPLFRWLEPLTGVTHSAFLRRLFGDPRRIRPGTLEGYQAPFARPGGFEHGLSVLKTWGRDLADLEAALPRIAHIPTLLLWGDKDTAVNPRSAEPLRRQFRDCRLIWFEGVGHVPYEEVPDDFNRTVVAFLKS